jgi:hypothetical protein
MTVPVPTEEVFLILKRYLPRGTYMSSAYRSPSDQHRVIQDLVNKLQCRSKKQGQPDLIATESDDRCSPKLAYVTHKA